MKEEGGGAKEEGIRKRKEEERRKRRKNMKFPNDLEKPLAIYLSKGKENTN